MICRVQKISYKTENTFLFNRPEPTKELNDACFVVEEEQTTQWPKGKVQKDKQQSTKHTHKTKDRVTRTPLRNVILLY
jgi:predicted KAP-like P-loop ATPase